MDIEGVDWEEITANVESDGCDDETVGKTTVVVTKEEVTNDREMGVVMEGNDAVLG